MSNSYYVYIYYRLDTNEPFYVGKGCRYRWKDLSRRNKHFKKIANKYPIAVDIIKDNLTDEEASGIECYIIDKLVFEYGFSIDIKNNEGNRRDYHLVNQTWGGEGSSGCIPSEETRLKMSKSRKGLLKGVPMSEQAKKNMSLNHANFKRSNNPRSKYVICLPTKRIFKCITDGADFYKCNRVNISKNCNGNRTTCGKLDDGTKLIWKYLNWEHGKIYRIKNKIYYNPNKSCYIYNKILNKKDYSNMVICLTTKRIFFNAKEGAKYYKCNDGEIRCCCKGYRIKNNKRIRVKSAGRFNEKQLIWRYLKFKHDKIYRIKKESNFII